MTACCMCDGVSSRRHTLIALLCVRPQGMSCFLVPRWLPDGSFNKGFRVMRLKDKLGDRSNASSEVGLTARASLCACYACGLTDGLPGGVLQCGWLHGWPTRPRHRHHPRHGRSHSSRLCSWQRWTDAAGCTCVGVWCKPPSCLVEVAHRTVVDHTRFATLSTTAVAAQRSEACCRTNPRWLACWRTWLWRVKPPP